VQGDAGTGQHLGDLDDGLQRADLAACPLYRDEERLVVMRARSFLAETRP